MIYFHKDSWPQYVGYFPQADAWTLSDIRLKYRKINFPGFPCVVYYKLETRIDLYALLHEQGHHVDMTKNNRMGYRIPSTPFSEIFDQEIEAWSYVFECVKPRYHKELLHDAAKSLNSYASRSSRPTEVLRAGLARLAARHNVKLS